jgi:quinol monooxygenase YgiN
MVGLVVRLDVHDEAAGTALDALLADLVEQVTANEPGALVFVVHTVQGEPLARIFYELYADEDAFRRHQETPYFRAFVAARTPLLAARRAERLDVAAAKGLPG